MVREVDESVDEALQPHPLFGAHATHDVHADDEPKLLVHAVDDIDELALGL